MWSGDHVIASLPAYTEKSAVGDRRLLRLAGEPDERPYWSAVEPANLAAVCVWQLFVKQEAGRVYRAHKLLLWNMPFGLKWADWWL